MNDYRNSLKAINNGPFSQWLSNALDIIFWTITGLFFVLAIALWGDGTQWQLSMTLLICAVLICPLTPIHFVAKLVVAGFVTLPSKVATILSIPVAVLTLFNWLKHGGREQ